MGLFHSSKGTPNDFAIGFATNWRSETAFAALDTSRLPWHHLLIHLQGLGPAAESLAECVEVDEQLSQDTMKAPGANDSCPGL